MIARLLLSAITTTPAAASPLPANAFYWAYPASIDEMRHFAGRWRGGSILVDVHIVGPGRVTVIEEFNRASWAMQNGYITKHEGAFYLSLDGELNIHDTPPQPAPALAASQCLGGGHLVIRSRARIEFVGIDPERTLKANPWLKPSDTRDENCPLPLVGMSATDQARLTLIDVPRGLRDRLPLRRTHRRPIDEATVLKRQRTRSRDDAR